MFHAMTSEHSQKDKPVFRTPNPTELKAAAAEDPIVDKYPQADGDVSDAHTEVKKVDDADFIDDRPDDGSATDQIVKANISGH